MTEEYNQDSEYKLCGCGCGQKITVFYKNRINNYIHGHNSKGISNPKFKGYRFSTHKIPRKMLNMPWHPNAGKDGYVYDYVWIMSRKLKRPLEKGEVVHHIDGNPRNNEITNLQLLPNQAEHMSITMKVDMSKRRCSKCESIETQENKNGWQGWYDDGNAGYLCRRCYCKKNYNYVKKGRSRKK